MIKSDAFNIYHDLLKTRQKGRGVVLHDGFEGLAWGFENQLGPIPSHHFILLPKQMLAWVEHI